MTSPDRGCPAKSGTSGHLTLAGTVHTEHTAHRAASSHSQRQRAGLAARSRAQSTCIFSPRVRVPNGRRGRCGRQVRRVFLKLRSRVRYFQTPQRICTVVDADGFLLVAREACPAVMHPRRFLVLQGKGFLSHFCMQKSNSILVTHWNAPTLTTVIGGIWGRQVRGSLGLFCTWRPVTHTWG